MTEQEIKEAIFGKDQFLGEDRSSEEEQFSGKDQSLGEDRSSEEEQFSGEDQFSGKNGTAGKVSTNDGDNTENVEKPSPDDNAQERARAEINTGIRIISASDRGDELLRKAFGLAG